MSAPRRTRADGERTREAIVRAAVSLATVDGLEGLSIGNLAAALEMSKSGVYAHFDSKQDLQLATVQEAERIFDAEVIEPALAAAPGLAQLVALCDAYFDHLLRRTFPGGCFFAGAALEMGTRPGPVKERIAAFQGRLTGLVRQLVVAAIERGELPSDEDPDALTFELNGLILAANTSFVLRQDEAALTMARHVMRRRLDIRESRPTPVARRRWVTGITPDTSQLTSYQRSEKAPRTSGMSGANPKVTPGEFQPTDDQRLGSGAVGAGRGDGAASNGAASAAQTVPGRGVVPLSR